MLPGIRCYVPVGREAGREIDVAALLQKDGAALLFIHELNRNSAPLIRALDEIGRARSLLGFRVFPIMLEADRSLAETRLKAVNRSLRLQSPILLSLDGAEGPGELALEHKAMLSLILTKNGKVVRSIGFSDPGRQDGPRITKWIEEIYGKLPVDEAAWRARLQARLPKNDQELRKLSVQLLLKSRAVAAKLRQTQLALRKAQAQIRRSKRRGGRANGRRKGRAGRQASSRPSGAKKRFEGKAPSDPRLRELIRPYIRKTNAPEQVDALYAQILAHAKGQAELEEQVREMFRLILSVQYGTEHARKLASDYVKKHAKHPRK